MRRHPIRIGRVGTRRRLQAAAVVAVAATALAGCGSSASSGPSASGTPGASKATKGGSVGHGQIKIGADIELSGRASLQGKAYRRAFKIVVDQVNQNGGVNGKKIQLIVRDNGSDPTKSVQVVKGFIKQHVDAIIGGGTTPTTLSMVDTAEKAHMPVESMASSGAILKPPNKRKYIFKTVPNTHDEVHTELGYLKKHSVKKVAVLSVNNPYGDAGLKEYQQQGPKYGVKVSSHVKVDAESKNYTSQLTKLIGTDPDALVFWALPPVAGVATKEARQLGWKNKQIYASNANLDYIYLNAAGSAANGVIMTGPEWVAASQVPSSTKNKDRMVSFHQKYAEVANGNTPVFASFAADAVGLLAHAIDKAGSTDHAAVRKALENATYTGVTGVFKITPDNHTGLDPSQLGILKIKDGKYKLVKPARGRS